MSRPDFTQAAAELFGEAKRWNPSQSQYANLATAAGLFAIAGAIEDLTAMGERLSDRLQFAVDAAEPELGA